ncbi:MAG: amino acid ABC transporter substrate-binding protein [Bdellovibrio sp. ArHS]|uniref:substrate-binding periplasmic protein n=1 Tax=Bdellovibrio sp. ArHS TaxID=1569284 RepID=UPI000583507E|nr:transporter substrate-binding domain-containing protein [Bdellovibrio sp. ArHS]KHD88770.1 MAG: amino acid ABC transporter substrate-binding protein [Bdellovibrio sp. ArHS]
MRFFWCVLVLIFLVSEGVWAKTIEFATLPIPLLVESSERGLFVNLTKEIAKRSKKQIHISVYPTGKALVAFSSHKVQVFFPGMEAFVPKKYVRSSAFYFKVDHIFFKKGRAVNSIKDLEGKKVGLTFRYVYAKELVQNKKIKFEYAADDILNMRKLAQGQIDAFVVEARSGLKALQLSGEKDIEFDKDAPLSEQEVFYAFHDDEEGKELAQIFTRAIDAMKKDGSLERIFKASP